MQRDGVVSRMQDFKSERYVTNCAELVPGEYVTNRAIQSSFKGTPLLVETTRKLFEVDH